MIDKLVKGLEKLELTFSNEQLLKLEDYIAEVLEFNKGYNLMKAQDEDELAVNHILDSLAAVPALKEIISELCNKTGQSVLNIGDIGSGGGCPGIPLAIAFADQNFTLVERMEKRCIFLETVVKKLGLTNVKIECKAADMITPQSFDLEVFRAFHPFDKKIIKLLFRMLKPHGYLAAYKAREEKIQAELNEIKAMIKDSKLVKLSVPFLEDHERHLVVIK